MEKDQIVKALNLWMDDYIEHPKEYEAMFQSVLEHLEARADGREPTYGEVGYELMQKLLANAVVIGTT